MRSILALLALASVMPESRGAPCPLAAVLRYEPRTFFGYECPDDCERHKAGYAWAERAGLTDAGPCAPLPGPGREGCTARIELASTPEAAGYRWALENEIVAACECAGAGERFEAGCLRQLLRTHRRGAN
jgi:hypothetical protein